VLVWTTGVYVFDLVCFFSTLSLFLMCGHPGPLVPVALARALQRPVSFLLLFRPPVYCLISWPLGFPSFGVASSAGPWSYKLFGRVP